MIDFYAMGSPNVARVYVALEELDLTYRVHLVDVFRGEQFVPDFVALNPNAKAPVIVDQNGPGGTSYQVFESGVILIYLADKTGRLLPAAGPARYDALQWLAVQITTVGPMFGQLIHFRRYAPPQANDYAEVRYRNQVKRVFETLEGRLARVPFLGGETYSVADIALFPWSRYLEAHFGADAEAFFPHLIAWRDGIARRPAVIRALAALDEIRSRQTPIEKSDTAVLDQLFSRR